jgi:integrase
VPQAALLEMPVPTKEKKSTKPRRNRGEGRIYRMKGRNVWMVQYYQNGRQIRESSGSTVKQVAVELLKERLSEVRTGAVPMVDAKKASYESMRDLLYDYYQAQECKSLFKKKDGSLCIGTVPPLDRFFKGCVASDITYNRLMAFVKDRQKAGKNPATINRSLASLKMMFREAVKAKLLPAQAVPEFPKLKEPPPRDDYFTLEEFTKVSAELPDYLKPVFAVAYYTGMRAAEILSRKWEHIDFEAGLIRILAGEAKNDDPRIVPIVGPVADILRAQRAANPQAEFVFVRDGQPIKSFKNAWKSALERAGLVAGRKGHVFHGARRSTITMHAEQGMAEDISMAITGHRDRTVHRRYRQMRASHILAAAKAFDESLASVGHATGYAEKPRKSKRRK